MCFSTMEVYNGRYLVSATPSTVLGPIPLKLLRCFNHGLKFRICTLRNPEIVFPLFLIFNVDIFVLDYYKSVEVVDTLLLQLLPQL